MHLIDAQEACRFPVEFDNFNDSASWNAIGADTWWRKFSFGITASEAWTLEFKVHLEGLQEIQKMAVGLVNDSDLSGCGNSSAQENLCFFGLTLWNKNNNGKKWIAEPFPAEIGKNSSIPETCFLRFECLHAFGARLTVFRDEELQDTVPETSQIFRLNSPFLGLNSFIIQLDPPPPALPTLKACISELRFFNGQPLSFPAISQRENAGNRQAEIELVPNPNRGDFRLHILADQQYGPAHIEIYNASGKVDYKLEYIGKDQQVELREPRPGLYLLKLYLNGTTVLRKFIVY